MPDLFWLLVVLLILAALWCAFRCPARTRPARTPYGWEWWQQVNSDGWDNPGWDGMLYFLTGAEYDKQFPNGTKK